MNSRPIGLLVMAVFYVVAGIFHFLKPRMYLKIMPPYLPAPLFLVYLSGLAEMGLGAALWVPALQVFAAWGIIALLIAIFPANVYMLQARPEKFKIPKWVLIARLPLQFVLIAWAYAYTSLHKYY